MTNYYLYIVARDLGLAPNPFHGFCTLACCKPKIRENAKKGDWVIGLAGPTLINPIKDYHLLYLMRVSERLTFNDYWNDPRFQDKKPKSIKKSLKHIVGDNVYYKNSKGKWNQTIPHQKKDFQFITKDDLESHTQTTENVLISNEFYYFGNNLKKLPKEIQKELKNLGTLFKKAQRGHRKLNNEEAFKSKKSEMALNSIKNIINLLDKDPNYKRKGVFGDPIKWDKLKKKSDIVNLKKYRAQTENTFIKTSKSC